MKCFLLKHFTILPNEVCKLEQFVFLANPVKFTVPPTYTLQALSTEHTQEHTMTSHEQMQINRQKSLSANLLLIR